MSGNQPWLLVCPPDFYGIEYEINPWMSRSRGADQQRVCRQWRLLYETILGLGAKVSLIGPVEGLPDMVFTANAGFVFRDRFISSRFRYDVRAKESPLFEWWFQSTGFEVVQLPDKMYFEGSGDVLFCGSTLFGG